MPLFLTRWKQNDFAWLRNCICFLALLLTTLAAVTAEELRKKGTPDLSAASPVATLAAPAEIPAALNNYLQAADNTYRWELLQSQELPGQQGRVWSIELTSQTWQGIVWKHALVLFEPAKLEFPDQALLFITGGKTGSQIREGDFTAGIELARMTGARCAFLLQVPNQPLMGEKFEDDLITETFLKYLETGDATWPLLFPMAKSAVRAMDAIQEFLTSQEQLSPEKFVVTGASKRGWTTWLTGATDARVVGIAPIVIDTLNFQVQMDHQLATWGKYSEQIDDYTRKGLIKVMKEQPEIPLWRWVDPYSYRQALTVPKLLINGTNDPYWVLDAMNNYWDDLPGEKQVLYVPNAGHGLQGGRIQALTTLAAFTRHLATATPLPEWSWEHTGNDKIRQLQIQAPSAKSARLWSAHSQTKDLRAAEWTSTELRRGDDSSGNYEAKLEKPAQGHIALYGEAQFEIQGLKYSLSTQVHVE